MRDDGPTGQGIAVAIAETYLNVLSGGSPAQLRQCLGQPAEQLLMGEDGRPYLVTAAGTRCAAGGFHLHVSVSDCGWTGDAAVVRSAVLGLGAERCVPDNHAPDNHAPDSRAPGSRASRSRRRG